MGDRHRGIGFQQHQGDRLAHQNAAPHHHGLFASRINAPISQNFHHAGRGATAQTRLTPHQPPQIGRVQPIGILVGVNFQQQGVAIQPVRQRQLHQNAIHVWIGVELMNDGG